METRLRSKRKQKLILMTVRKQNIYGPLKVFDNAGKQEVKSEVYEGNFQVA